MDKGNTDKLNTKLLDVLNQTTNLERSRPVGSNNDIMEAFFFGQPQRMPDSTSLRCLRIGDRKQLLCTCGSTQPAPVQADV
ncbi:Os05g0591575 [Oryza sativa Japonica Group]|uniref:Os05g0591575 protein n=1 Tax=Oryza sativa subsp. japonica TaxID=39947 RepID=A0A0P0WR10_ORYSJ|nr:Os05g0591575 [Oryza sativa Japonica Group]